MGSIPFNFGEVVPLPREAGREKSGVLALCAVFFLIETYPKQIQ